MTVHIPLGPIYLLGATLTASVGHNAMAGECPVKPDDLAERGTAGDVGVGVSWMTGIRGSEIKESERR